MIRQSGKISEAGIYNIMMRENGRKNIFHEEDK